MRLANLKQKIELLKQHPTLYQYKATTESIQPRSRNSAGMERSSLTGCKTKEAVEHSWNKSPVKIIAARIVTLFHVLALT